MTKLHLGCGWRNFGKDWVHVDGGDYDHLDDYDITRLSFNDNTVDLIYASHVLEYFDREEAFYVLGEWGRVLKGGATLRIAVPDFESMVGLYCHETYALENFLGPLYGKMTMSDKTIYHKTIYDFNSLRSLLEHSGFHNIKKYNWRDTEHAALDDRSQAYLPHMDKTNGKLMSLNVEATKL